jgi:transcriptional regulator with XRE-family HTH domain
MKLDYYLFKNKIKQNEFAKKLGIKPAHLSRIVNNKVTPHLELAILIQDLTQGEVPCEDLVKEK